MISVVIPTFNRADFIGECLESVFIQTKPVSEVIVIDNCSTDETIGIVESFKHKFDNLRVIKNRINVGMVANWNAGASLVTNPYFSILHSDDTVPSYWNEVLVNYISSLQDHSIGIFFGDVSVIEKKAGRWRPYSIHQFFPQSRVFSENSAVFGLWKNFWGNPGCSAGITYHTESFNKLGGFCVESGAEADQDLHIRIMSRFRVGYCQRSLVNYRLHDYQAFDYEKIKENYNVSYSRLINSIRIQEEHLPDNRLLRYTRVGCLYYVFYFVFRGRLKLAFRLAKTSRCFDLGVLLLVPRFILSKFKSRLQR